MRMEQRKSVKKAPIVLAYLGLLVAMQVVLGNLLQITFVEKQFHLGFLPIALAGALFGPIGGMVVGGLGDLIGAHVFPAGPYFIGFTATNIVVGFVYGLVLYRQRPVWWRAGLALVLVSICYLMLNSYWLSMLYTSKTYWVWVGVRAPSYVAEIPVYGMILYFTLRALSKVRLPVFLTLRGVEVQRGAEASGSVNDKGER